MSFPSTPSTPTGRSINLATNVTKELEGYQADLEDVLTWLLEAEDKLNQAPEFVSNLNGLKEQFHEHKSFLMKLSSHQDDIGVVLQEGARLLAEGSLHKDKESEVRVQMSLLNSQWEGVRTRSMDRFILIRKVTLFIFQFQRLID